MACILSDDAAVPAGSDGDEGNMQTGYLIAALPCALIGLTGWRNHRLFRRRGAAAPLSTPPVTTPAPAASEVEAAPACPAFVPGKTPFAAETRPAGVVLQDALRALDGEAARHLTRLTVAAAPGLTLRADPAALGQALQDIVGGAIRRSPHGRVLVCAALHGGRVQVSVADEGTGAGEDALAELSEATRTILALHGGTLEVESAAGEGTTFRFTLPPNGPGEADAAEGVTPGPG